MRLFMAIISVLFISSVSLADDGCRYKVEKKKSCDRITVTIYDTEGEELDTLSYVDIDWDDIFSRMPKPPRY